MKEFLQLMTAYWPTVAGIIFIVSFVSGIVLASVLVGYRIAKGMVPTEGRSSNLGQTEKPGSHISSSGGDYIEDALISPESIRRDREGHRLFSTTKED